MKEKEELLSKRSSEIDYYQDLELAPEEISALELSENSDLFKGTNWWERLNLFQNPFPTTIGLAKIDPKYYNEVVLKTEIFERYFSSPLTQRVSSLIHFS